MPYKDPEKAKARNVTYYAAHREAEKAASATWRAEHPEKVKGYNATYISTHRQEKKESNAAYRASHPDEEKARDKADYAAHREEEKARRRVYYAAHREEIKQRQAVYDADHREKRKGQRAAHPEVSQINCARRRAKKKGLPATLTVEQWEVIKIAYGNRCAYCGKKPGQLTQDHVIPLSKGGGTIAENIVPACKSCNSKKRANLPVNPVKLVLV